MKRLPFVSALCLAATVLAAPVSPTPTQAWRKIFLGSAGHTLQNVSAVTDASGNGYLSYTDVQSAVHTIHVVKLSPPMGVVFDKTIDFVPTGYSSQLVMSPVISGKQYLYLFILDAVNNNQSMYVYKWDTAGNVGWGGNLFIFNYPGTAPMGIAGTYTDATGNFSMVFRTPVPGSAGAAYFWNLDTNGTVTSSHLNTDIYPTSAFYSTVLNGWILAGVNETAGDVPDSARWAFFDRVAGTTGFGGTANGTFNAVTGARDQEQFIVSGMDANTFSITHNTILAAGVSGPYTRNTSMNMYASNGTLSWSYPSSGTRSGTVNQVATLTGSGLIYDCGTETASGPEFVDQLNTSGTLIFHHRYQPADQIFPWSDGFFTTAATTSNEYLEHSNPLGTYDFGKSYLGAGPTADTFGAWAGFRNALWVAMVANNTSATTDIVLDRFITGVAVQSLTAASTVQGGQTLTVTINLNQGAPAGGYPVGVSTSNNKLLLPNGTQGQYITVPAGMSSTTVILNAQTVAGSTPTRVLGIADGVRRFVDTAVTP